MGRATMTFEIEVAGRTRVVNVERDGAHHFRVTVDGLPLHLDAIQPAPGAWSILHTDTGRSDDVILARGPSVGEFVASIGGRTVSLVVNGRRARRTDDAGGPAGAHRVVAPMPGKVLRVLVQVGDTIAARQPLVVVEAMKMENELSAPRAGRITDIHVEPGVSVEAGRLLLVVE
jgi:biotin carboxyl carrier protein